MGKQLLQRRWRRSGWALVALLAATAVAVFSPRGQTEVTGPGVQDRNVTSIVTTMMRTQHVSHHPLDDEISERAVHLLLQAFDGRKLYFYQSDIDEFQRYRHQLDDMLKKRDTSFAYLVYRRFTERLEERSKWIEDLLKQDFDYTRREYLDTDFDNLKYPTNAEEAKERWRKRIKYDLLFLEVIDKKSPKEAREQIARRYRNIRRRWKQFDNNDLLEVFLTSVTNAYDPHTSYMSAPSYENFKIQLSLRLNGIGAQLKDEDGYAVIAKIIPGGAADKHGKLKAGDRIVSVGQGEEGEMVDVVDMKLDDIVKMIRGKAGTIVRLGVVPASGGEKQIYTITRARIELADSAAKGKVFDVPHPDGGEAIQIGVIDLPSFYFDMEGARNGVANYRSTTADVRRILQDFEGKGVDVVVLDLRSNGGGSLTEAINLTGLFIDRGPVVQVRDSANRVDALEDENEGMAWSGPLLVLTSKLSASASEILAGAIQDYGRGLIVGDQTTHGKGTVQTLQDLDAWLLGRARHRPSQLGALKITTAQFYRPGGDSTQKRGVLADIALPSLTTHMDIGEADLEYAIDFDRIQAAEFQRYAMVTRDIVRKLIERSQSRREKSEDFAKLNRRIAEYLEQKAQKKIALNREEYIAAHKEFNARKAEEDQFEKQINPDDTIRRDYYLNEVFQIGVDYLRELEKLHLARRR